jgi:hypothetical protein
MRPSGNEGTAVVCASQIDILASLVHPRIGNRRNRFVMIEAYFDESGIHDKAKVCVVAGYYGSQAAWWKFEKQWQAIISGYPELYNYGFHAKVFFGRTDTRERLGPYKGWSDDKAGKFLDRLMQAIIRNRIFPISYGIVTNDFLVLPLKTRQWLTGAKFDAQGNASSSGCPNKGYYLPFSFCVLDSSRMSGANKVEKIHFFAGLDRTFYEYANSLYRFILEDSRLPTSIKSLLGQISYPLAKDTPGLQAADLLSNRLYRFALSQLEAGGNLPIPSLVTKLTRNRKVGQRFELFDSARLHKLEILGRQMYEELAQGGRVEKYITDLHNS